MPVAAGSAVVAVATTAADINRASGVEQAWVFPGRARQGLVMGGLQVEVDCKP
jgi:hypothetical protein